MKADYERQADAPFKKNPKIKQLTIDFVRDMEKRGLVSRCTAEEQQFVCNSLMLPKTQELYRSGLHCIPYPHWDLQMECPSSRDSSESSNIPESHGQMVLRFPMAFGDCMG